MESILTENYLIKVFNNTENAYDAGRLGNLWYYYKQLLYAPNAYHGYHNFRHMCHVTCEVYDACQYMKVDKETFLVMLLAAIFHDYGHTGKPVDVNPDSVNIGIAVDSVKIHIHSTHSHLLPRIIPFIKATEFPHAPLVVDENQELFLAIRDADMSQSLFSVWVQQTIFGMGAEQNKSREDMLKGQLPFLQHYLKFHSAWGKERFLPMLDTRIQEVALIKEKVFDTDY